MMCLESKTIIEKLAELGRVYAWDVEEGDYQMFIDNESTKNKVLEILAEDKVPFEVEYRKNYKTWSIEFNINHSTDEEEDDESLEDARENDLDDEPIGGK